MAESTIKYATVSVRLEQSEKEILERFAADQQLTMSQVIRKAIKYYIDYSD